MSVRDQIEKDQQVREARGEKRIEESAPTPPQDNAPASPDAAPQEQLIDGDDS